MWTVRSRRQSWLNARGMEPDTSQNSWTVHELYSDTRGLAKYLGTTVDAVNQTIADGTVLYLLTADGEALMPWLGEMTALMDGSTMIGYCWHADLRNGASQSSGPVTPSDGRADGDSCAYRGLRRLGLLGREPGLRTGLVARSRFMDRRYFDGPPLVICDWSFNDEPLIRALAGL